MSHRENVSLVTDTTTTTTAETENEKDEGETEDAALLEERRKQILANAPMVIRLILKDGTALDRGTMWAAFGKDPAKVDHFVVHTDGQNKPTHVDIYARHSEESEAFKRGRLHKITLFSSMFDGFVTAMNARDAEAEREMVTIAKAMALAAEVKRRDASLEDEEGDAPDVVTMAVDLVAHRNMPPKQAVKVAFEILDAVDEYEDAAPAETAKPS